MKMATPFSVLRRRAIAMGLLRSVTFKILIFFIGLYVGEAIVMVHNISYGSL